MAITSAAMQAELGTGAMSPRVIHHFGVNGLLQCWYIWGGAVYAGRIKRVNTTAADSAATQAAAVATAFLAGPA